MLLLNVVHWDSDVGIFGLSEAEPENIAFSEQEGAWTSSYSVTITLKLMYYKQFQIKRKMWYSEVNMFKTSYLTDRTSYLWQEIKIF